MVRKVAEKPLKRIFDRELSLITERYNINNQIEQSNTELKVSSTFSAGGSAVFREAFRVSKRLQRHNTKVLLDFFLKNRAGQGAQSPLKARTNSQTLSASQINTRLDMFLS